MPSFSDSIFLFVLALLLFGPKKLPVLARELGKWVGEFRRASNEFKSQMEEELRMSEQAERTKHIAEMVAAAPVTPALAEPEHPHTDSALVEGELVHVEGAETTVPDASATPEPLPIATSGDLNMMPPATGLPVARNGASEAGTNEYSENALGGLIDAIPHTPEVDPEAKGREGALYGD